MPDRYFSDAIQFNVVKANLEKNKGNICCEICGKRLQSISECHFDHVIPYAKGGKSTSDNCQILCADCNLKKSDKQLKDAIIDEQVRKFLNGEPLENSNKKTSTTEADKHEKQKTGNDKKGMTKEKFDEAISEFIEKNGNIKQIDFNREQNHLPGISYMLKYYGNLKNMKIMFGIPDISLNWNRESIIEALKGFVSKHGDIKEKDFRKKNGLPALNCIMRFYPECKNLTDVKRLLCGLPVPEHWTMENVIEAGRKFVKLNNGKLTGKDCKSENGLPATSIIYKYFGDMTTFQMAIGSETSDNVYVSREKVAEAVERYFAGKERSVESRKAFFEDFPYGYDVIKSRFGSVDSFTKEYGIIVLKKKKNKYSKQEIDDTVSEYIKSGNSIPKHCDLKRNGLPSASVIMRYYDHWREPFEIYQALYKKAGITT